MKKILFLITVLTGFGLASCASPTLLDVITSKDNSNTERPLQKEEPQSTVKAEVKSEPKIEKYVLSGEGFVRNDKVKANAFYEVVNDKTYLSEIEVYINGNLEAKEESIYIGNITVGNDTYSFSYNEENKIMEVRVEWTEEKWVKPRAPFFNKGSALQNKLAKQQWENEHPGHLETKTHFVRESIFLE